MQLFRLGGSMIPTNRYLTLSLAMALFASSALPHASGPGHQHSTSVAGDSFGGSSFGSGSSPSSPPQVFGGGGTFSAPPPPPPPEPPRLSTPGTVKGTGEGAESKVKKVGKPSQGDSSADRPVRVISDAYSDTPVDVDGETKGRTRTRYIDFVNVD